jgi:hypothetical protein
LTTQQRERDTADLIRRERLQGLIAAAVIRALGRPDDLRTVQVRWLWDDNYRVNVFTGADGASAAIAHSHFLRADGAGEIVEAFPAIVRRY